MTQHDFEERLRGMLATHAADAPRSEDVERRVLTDVLTERPPRHIPWRSFGAPLIAAGAVAAVVAALVGVEHVRTTATKHTQPAAPSPSTSAPAPVVPVPTTPITPPPTTSTVANIGVSHFAAIDLTFVGNDAWAYGTADCPSGSQEQVCSALLRTADGGATWKLLPRMKANIPGLTCDDPCVQHIRFATDKIGYAFGLDSLFMTLDGGSTWARQPGGALALETLDGTVIRVSTGCLPGCPNVVQTAPIGKSDWQTRTLAGTQPGFGAALVRVGSSAYVDFFGHTAGGAENATSVFYSSSDDGASWVRRGEPCPQIGGGAAGNEVDSTALATADDGTLVVLCTPRGSLDSFVVTSTDGGATFARGTGTVSTDTGGLGATSSSGLFVVTSDGLLGSSDGGASWHNVGIPALRSARWLGFQSATTGRAVSDTGASIWTTRDAGATWTATTFP